MRLNRSNSCMRTSYELNFLWTSIVARIWLICYYVLLTIWLFNSSPWKITMLIIGKPSISMGHLYHGYVSHNQRVQYILHLASGHHRSDEIVIVRRYFHVVHMTQMFIVLISFIGAWECDNSCGVHLWDIQNYQHVGVKTLDCRVKWPIPTWGDGNTTELRSRATLAYRSLIGNSWISSGSWEMKL